jgi:hypothetical protein
MFQKLKKLRLPFLPKKLIEVPMADQIDAALMESRNYSLLIDNDDLDKLFKNKFKTDSGIQIPPGPFIEKMITHIENNPPQTTEAFALYVKTEIAAIRPEAIKKKSWWQRN